MKNCNICSNEIVDRAKNAKLCRLCAEISLKNSQHDKYIRNSKANDFRYVALYNRSPLNLQKDFTIKESRLRKIQMQPSQEDQAMAIAEYCVISAARYCLAIGWMDV